MMLLKGQGRDRVRHVLKPRKGHWEIPSRAQCCPDKDFPQLFVVILLGGTQTPLNPGPSAGTGPPASPRLRFLNCKTQDNTRQHVSGFALQQPIL